MAAAEGQLRRLVGSGHAVGLSVPGQSLDGARAALEEGAGLLEQLVRVRPHTCLLYTSRAMGLTNGEIFEEQPGAILFFESDAN